MYIDRIELSNADRKTKTPFCRAVISHMARGYRVELLTYSGDPYHGKSLYLVSVYQNQANFSLDYAHAKHYACKTAIKHAENLLSGKYKRR